jgi:hypothetical protein
MRRQPSLIGLAAVVAATLLAAASARTATPASCTTPGLVVWIQPTGNAAAGTTYLKLEFTNQSGHTCILRGYPGVSAVDLHGRPLGSPAARNPSRAPATIRLADGATAGALLGIAFAGNYPPGACRRDRAAGVRVYPPNTTAAKIAPIPFDACSRPGPVYLHVNPLGS